MNALNLEGHRPTAVAVSTGRHEGLRWRASCTCGCIYADDVTTLHRVRADAIDEARTILEAVVHGPPDTSRHVPRGV